MKSPLVLIACILLTYKVRESSQNPSILNGNYENIIYIYKFKQVTLLYINVFTGGPGLGNAFAGQDTLPADRTCDSCEDLKIPGIDCSKLASLCASGIPGILAACPVTCDSKPACCLWADQTPLRLQMMQDFLKISKPSTIFITTDHKPYVVNWSHFILKNSTKNTTVWWYFM